MFVFCARHYSHAMRFTFALFSEGIHLEISLEKVPKKSFCAPKNGSLDLATWYCDCGTALALGKILFVVRKTHCTVVLCLWPGAHGMAWQSQAWDGFWKPCPYPARGIRVHARTHTRSGTGTIFMPVPECPKCPKYPKIKKILKFQKNVTKLFLLFTFKYYFIVIEFNWNKTVFSFIECILTL